MSHPPYTPPLYVALMPVHDPREVTRSHERVDAAVFVERERHIHIRNNYGLRTVLYRRLAGVLMGKVYMLHKFRVTCEV